MPSFPQKSDRPALGLPVMEHPGRVATTSTPTQAPRDFETHSKERKVSHNPARGMGVPWVKNTIISLAS